MLANEARLNDTMSTLLPDSESMSHTRVLSKLLLFPLWRFRSREPKATRVGCSPDKGRDFAFSKSMIDMTLDLENYFPTPRRNLNATKFFVLLPIPCNVITFEKEWESFGVTAVVIKGCVGIFRSTQPGEGLDASYTNKFFLCSEGSVGVHRLSECIIGALIIQREQFWLHITS
jgi:hypothetical protein